MINTYLLKFYVKKAVTMAFWLAVFVSLFLFGWRYWLGILVGMIVMASAILTQDAYFNYFKELLENKRGF